MNSRRILVILLLVPWLLVNCSQSRLKSQDVSLPPTPHLELPTIVVDDKHRSFEGGESVEYEITPGIGLILDASGYEFQYPADANFSAPNMIQVMTSRESFYGVPWKEGVTRYSLTMETLNPLGNSRPFSGFYAGMQVIVAIGYQRDISNFYVLWAGIVKVLDKD